MITKRFYFELQREREETRRRWEEEDREWEEKQRRRVAAENAEGEEERQPIKTILRQLIKTTLPEYLAGCHNYFKSGLTVPMWAVATQGDPANTERKLRPERLRTWDDFPASQEANLDGLDGAEFRLEGAIHDYACIARAERVARSDDNKLRVRPASFSPTHS